MSRSVSAESCTQKQVGDWFVHCVDREANNNLLLEMDEWGFLTKLKPLHSFYAAGEKGSCPQEHSLSPASWISSQILSADEFAKRSRDCKCNKTIEQNVFCCFAHVLNQYYSFDWFTKCYISSVNPIVTVRKLLAYLNKANTRNPPTR